MESFLSRLAASALGIATAAFAPQALAQTPPCGTVLMQSVRLTASMQCPNSVPALIVGADNVRIELGGFDISGQGPAIPGLSTAPAIAAHGRDGLEVLGPGRVAGYLWDVLISGGHAHVVSGISGGSLGGIGLRGASDSKVLDNDLAYGVSITDDLGPPTFARNPAVANEVLRNRIGRPAPRDGFVYVAGCFSQKNTVADNEINGKAWLDEGARVNVVKGNRMSCSSAWSNTAVHLREASENEIVGNVIDPDGATGISIDSSGTPWCGNRSHVGDANQVLANYIRNGSTGLRVTLAIFPPPWVSVAGNVIRGNTFVDMTVSGQAFGTGSANNDGRNNKYWNVPIDVEDFGTGNLWP